MKIWSEKRKGKDNVKKCCIIQPIYIHSSQSGKVNVPFVIKFAIDSKWACAVRLHKLINAPNCHSWNLWGEQWVACLMSEPKPGSLGNPYLESHWSVNLITWKGRGYSAFCGSSMSPSTRLLIGSQLLVWNCCLLSLSCVCVFNCMGHN